MLQVDQFEYEDLGQRATPLFLELFSGDPGSFEVVRSLVEQQGADRVEIGKQEEKVTCPQPQSRLLNLLPTLPQQSPRIT